MVINKDNLIFALVGLLIGGVLVWQLSPGLGGMMGGDRMAGSIDAHFIEQMIPHHEDALTMAEIALEKATHSEIKQLALDIQRTQSAEIETMQTWYQDWFGQEVPDVFADMGHGMGSGSMHMGVMGDDTDIERLQTAANFDQEFIAEMIPHHQMAIMMAQMLERSTDRPEMKQLAQDIIEAQTREVELMRVWSRQWYGE